MKERPILFKAQMVRALLNGSKTQTRRVVKNEAPDDADGCLYVDIDGLDTFAWTTNGDDQDVIPSADQFTCPYGQPSDRLWVRETWQAHRRTSYEYDEWEEMESPKDRHDDQFLPCYRADGKNFPDRWFPAIHMPRQFSRILLEIVSVRVERLQNISESAAAAEGLIYSTEHIGHWSGTGEQWFMTARQAYRNLWESINGPGSWGVNPWVWVIKFKRVPA